jgi:hypothetical protein
MATTVGRMATKGVHHLQRLLYSLLCRAAWTCSQRRAPSTAHDRWRAVRTAATGTNACIARRAPPARWPCTAVHAIRCSCGLLARCSVACALPETGQGCGSVRSTLLERCRWPAVHVVRWGLAGGSFRRTARAVNFYYFRSSVHLLAPCTLLVRRRVTAARQSSQRTSRTYFKYCWPPQQ